MGEGQRRAEIDIVEDNRTLHCFLLILILDVQMDICFDCWWRKSFDQAVQYVQYVGWRTTNFLFGLL